MNRIAKRLANSVAVAGVSILVFGAVCYAIGARINTTRSIPVGLYWTSKAPIKKGEYVMFCPPPLRVFAVAKERDYIAGGFCPGDYGYMMKQVLAAKGDNVAVTSAGVLVDGHLLPHSKPLAVDPAGRPLPRYQVDRYTLKGDELLLMSNVSDLSFDGRYFGPIARTQVQSVIRPIITW